MKNLLSGLILALCFAVNAQDTAFITQLKELPSAEAARSVADGLAVKLATKHVHYKTREFDNGLLRIVYVPEGMTEDQVKAQADYEDCFVADFRAVAGAGGKVYVFDMAKARYAALFPAWKHFFRPNATADKKTQRYTDTAKGLQYSFINRGDVWAIGR